MPSTAGHHHPGHFLVSDMATYYQDVCHPHLPVSDTFVMHLSAGETTALEPGKGSHVNMIQNCKRHGDGYVGTRKYIEMLWTEMESLLPIHKFFSEHLLPL